MPELNDTIEKVDLNVVGKESQGCLAGYGREIRRHTAQMITAEIFPSGWTWINKREGTVKSNCREDGMSQRSSPRAGLCRQ
jgi:hypothetical protein